MGSQDATDGGSGAVEQVVVPLRGGPLPSDPKAIEELIDRRRASLASTIDELVVRAHPKQIARRSAADARSRVTAFAMTPEGGLRTERLVVVTGAAVAAAGLLLVLRWRLGGAR